MSKREKWQGDTTDHARPNTIKRHKTAIEQEMEEAEEYERRKETEQRRAQEIKLLSQDDQSTPAKNPLRNTSRHCDDKLSQCLFHTMLLLYFQVLKHPRPAIDLCILFVDRVT